MSNGIQFQTLKNILVITLSDRETKNAFSPHLAEEFHQIRKSEKHSGLILKAEGPFFCSGGNLKHYQKLETPQQGIKQNLRIQKILKSLYESTTPTLAIIDGVCLGGGIELVSAFHHVLASPQALFGLWQRRIGLTFGWGGQERLESRLGKGRTQQWLLAGATVPAWQARDWGLVDQVVASHQIEKRGVDWMTTLIETGTESYGQIQKAPDKAFKKLWMKGRHREILKKF